MKDMKKLVSFLIKCTAICAGVLALLLLLNHRYEQVMDRPYSDTEKFDFIGTSFTDIQICNVGSSHGEYAFDYTDLMDNRGYECFNFAMSSQTYNYDYAVLANYGEYLADDCILFIPVSYFSFNNEVTNDTETKNLNTKYYTFLSPKYVPDYSLYVDLVTHRLPILSAGEELSRLLPEFSIKALAADGEAPSVDEFYQKALSRYQRHMENKEVYFMEERMEDLRRILDYCKENGITPVLITAPYTSLYSDMAPDSFKQELTAVVESVCASTGANYYDYSEDERFSEDLTLFSDADHLNETGAAIFMKTIEQEIPEFRDFLAKNKPVGVPVAAPAKAPDASAGSPDGVSAN